MKFCVIFSEFIPTKLVKLIKMLMNVRLTSGNKINIKTCLSGAYNSQDRQIFLIHIVFRDQKGRYDGRGCADADIKHINP
jgi:hypothetical protein